MFSRSTACLRALGAAGAPRGAGSQEKSPAGAAALGAGGGGAGAAALGAGGGGAGAPAFLICGISAWGVGGGPPTAAMAARTRAAKASSAQIEKALTDFLGCARTNARARTLSEPEAARRAESAAALMEEEIAKDMMVVGCVCGAEGVRRRGSTWRLDTRFGWFSFVVADGLKLAKLAQRLASVRFNAKWHAASSARVPGGGRVSARPFNIRELSRDATSRARIRTSSTWPAPSPRAPSRACPS
mmetsp:Transcript_8606/g.34795  ORF Transcript_8606/g.34795 Transcript_8606/m.34795 type:complete len:244 (-) Transcript_8606:279-1010(-)